MGSGTSKSKLPKQETPNSGHSSLKTQEESVSSIKSCTPSQSDLAKLNVGGTLEEEKPKPSPEAKNANEAAAYEKAVAELPKVLAEFAKISSPSITDFDSYRTLSCCSQFVSSKNFSASWADELARQNFVDIVAMPLWTSMFDTAKGIDILTDEELPQQTMDAMRHLMVVLWNCSCSDRSAEMCKQISSRQLVTKSLELLSRPYFEPIGVQTGREWNGGGNTHEHLLFRSYETFAGIVHNCFLHCYAATKKEFREARGVETMTQFSASNRVPLMRAKALVNLAYGVEEDESALLASGSDIFTFFVDVLLKVALDPGSGRHSRRAKGFSVEEIVCALNALAVSDANKLQIVNAGALPLYEQILEKPDSDKELLGATRGVWILSFHSEIRTKLIKMEEIIKSMERLQTHSDEQIKKAASGALWNLQSLARAKSARVATAKQGRKESKQEDGSPKKPHLMISYNWTHKEIARKLNEKLKTAGFETWIDVDKMTGSTLEAMAEAVEHCKVMLMLVSEEYKNSPACRMEAEYAMRLRKEIVPVLMTYRYRADGWLGILIGAKLHFDASSLEKVDTIFPLIVKELANHGVTSSQSPPVQVVHPTAVAAPQNATATPLPDTVTSWTRNDVLGWLRDIGLGRYAAKFDKIDGVRLRQLFTMYERSPDTYYRTVEQKLGFNDSSHLCDMLQFTHELENVFT